MGRSTPLAPSVVNGASVGTLPRLCLLASTRIAFSGSDTVAR